MQFKFYNAEIKKQTNKKLHKNKEQILNDIV